MVNIDRLIGSEHQGVDREMLACFYAAALSEGGTVDEINLRAIRAVIARWSSQQPLRPIPVSERPWERQDWCNKDGWCWFGWADEPDASWSFCKPSERDTATVSLAAHALPLPEVDHG